MCAYSVIPSDRVYYITTTVIDWIDVFTRLDYRKTIIESLEFCTKNKGMSIHAYVLMTNHLHLIVSHDEGIEAISQVIGDFKKFTSRDIIRQIMENDLESRRSWILHRLNEEKILQNPDANCSISKSGGEHYHLWQRGFDSFCITNLATLRQKIDYIHNNPVAAGIVSQPWEYLYSSARNYVGEPGVMNIDKIEFGPKNYVAARRKNY